MGFNNEANYAFLSIDHYFLTSNNLKSYEIYGYLFNVEGALSQKSLVHPAL